MQTRKPDNEGSEEMNDLIKNSITSMEVAEMVGKKHSDLLKDIRRYVNQLAEGKIHSGDFFKEST